MKDKDNNIIYSRFRVNGESDVIDRLKEMEKHTKKIEPIDISIAAILSPVDIKNNKFRTVYFPEGKLDIKFAKLNDRTIPYLGSSIVSSFDIPEELKGEKGTTNKNYDFMNYPIMVIDGIVRENMSPYQKNVFFISKFCWRAFQNLTKENLNKNRFGNGYERDLAISDALYGLNGKFVRIKYREVNGIKKVIALIPLTKENDIIRVSGKSKDTPDLKDMIDPIKNLKHKGFKVSYKISQRCYEITASHDNNQINFQWSESTANCTTKISYTNNGRVVVQKPKPIELPRIINEFAETGFQSLDTTWPEPGKLEKKYEKSLII